MNRVAWGAGAATVVFVLGVQWKHDRDEARRYAGLSKRLADLAEVVRSSSDIASAAPPALRGSCVLDSAQLDVIARVVSGAAAGSAARAAAPAPQEVPKEAQPTPEQEAALARAKDVLDGMLKRRRITRDDALELRREMAATGSPQAIQEIERRISVAINRDELVPDDPRFIP
jgi:hypothetical protein